MSYIPAAPLAWRLFRALVRTEVQFFVRSAPRPGIDILKLYNMPAPIAGAANLRRATVLIDLTQDEEPLFAQMDSRCRKGVRQAERAGVRVERFETLTEVVWRDFTRDFAKLTARKAKADPLAMGQIHELVATGRFALSAAYGDDGAALSWHGYIVSNGTARLYATMSNMDPARGTEWNNMVGRAHRLHHWRDMQRFKAAGIAIYDMGGIYRGQDDPEQCNIARFKTCFGGSFADTFDAALALTNKGRLVQALRRLKPGNAQTKPKGMRIERQATQIR